MGWTNPDQDPTFWMSDKLFFPSSYVGGKQGPLILTRCLCIHLPACPACGKDDWSQESFQSICPALKCLYLSWLTESFAIHDAAHDTLLHFSASHQQKLSCQASICATPCPPHSRYSYFLCSFPQLLLSWAFLPSPPLGLGYTRTGKRTFHIPS